MTTSNAIPAVVSLSIGGKEIQIKTLTTGQVLKLMPLVKEIRATLADNPADEISIFELIADNAQTMLEALAIATNISTEALEETGPDELVIIAKAVIELNKSFFTQRVLPAITK